MCDHCRTFKPVLEETVGPRTFEIPKPVFSAQPIPPRPPRNANDKGCCDWRRTCCDGKCCSTIGNCCAPPQGYEHLSPENQAAPSPATAYNSYGYASYSYSQPPIPSYSFSMTGGAMPDRVPCVTTKEKKLPMCFGGDCQDSPECTGISNGNAANDEQSMPRESER